MTTKYTRQQAQRDLNAHKAAMFATYHWHDRYAAQSLGAMGFWDLLTDTEREFARWAVIAIEAAPAEPV